MFPREVDLSQKKIGIYKFEGSLSPIWGDITKDGILLFPFTPVNDEVYSCFSPPTRMCLVYECAENVFHFFPAFYRFTYTL